MRGLLLSSLFSCALPFPLGALALAHEADAPNARASQPEISDSPRLSFIRPASDFALVDTNGRPVRLSALRGRVVLLAFIYTSCSTACPLLTQRMAWLQKELSRSGLQGSQVQFLSVTVDPERDSAAALARYAARFGAESDGWRFLREEPERLQPVLSAYGEWTRPIPDGEMDHPARVFLIDSVGRIREIYSLSFFDERQALVDIRALLREAG
ncbi:MAG: SCO family protein [Nitrospirae bacterium]|nr:SCO family protein [Nitrospirota bacterium]